MREVVRRNRVRDGLVYLQVSRGAARRDHGFPPDGTKPGLVVVARSLDPAAGEARAAAGVAVITLPEQRWARPDIKTLQLLPNVLAKQSAREAGAFEAWFVDRAGFVTEGRFDQRLDRHARRRARHPAGGRGDPARRDPRRADRHRAQAWPSPRGAAVHAARGATARARPSFPAPPRSPCPSSRSTAQAIGEGGRDRWLRRFGGRSATTAERSLKTALTSLFTVYVVRAR